MMEGRGRREQVERAPLAMAQQEGIALVVMLSGAKHLYAHRDRSFAPLRMTTRVPGCPCTKCRGTNEHDHTEEPCHAERSEASLRPSRQILRFAQDDKRGHQAVPARSEGDNRGHQADASLRSA